MIIPFELATSYRFSQKNKPKVSCFQPLTQNRLLLSTKEHNPYVKKKKNFLSALHLLHIKDSERPSSKTVRLFLEISNDKTERSLKVILPSFHLNAEISSVLLTDDYLASVYTSLTKG